MHLSRIVVIWSLRAAQIVIEPCKSACSANVACTLPGAMIYGGSLIVLDPTRYSHRDRSRLIYLLTLQGNPIYIGYDDAVSLSDRIDTSANHSG